MQKIGIYGGTFDPIHLGHLITAQYISEIRNLDKIFFVPCFQSPHKLNLKPSSPNNRLTMVKLAMQNSKIFDVSDFEINNKGISYTLDTVEYFKQKFEEIDLIIGYDNLLTFDLWHEPDKIISMVNLVVMKRSAQTSNKVNKYFEYATFVNTPTIDISSSEIRERIQLNKPVDFLLPPAVSDYIKENKLYRRSSFE